MLSPALTRAVNVLLLAAAGLCILVLLWFFYLYTLSGQREFGGALHAAVYYGAPLAAASLLLAALRLRPEQRLILVLVGGSLAVALYVGEITLDVVQTLRAQANETITAGQHTPERLERIGRMAARHGVEFDTRMRLDVTLDLRAESELAVPAVPPRHYLEERPDGRVVSTIRLDGEELVPLGGLSNATTVLCNESGDYVIYTADEHGFRNPPGTWDVEPEIVAIGDSYTEGFCVDADSSFVGRIRTRHPRTLNLGFGGSGPLFQLAQLEEYVRPLEPDHVIWFYFEGNDHWDLLLEGDNEVLLRYLREEGFRQNLRERQDEVDRVYLEMVEAAIEEELHQRRHPEEDRWWEPRQLVRAVTRPARFPTIRQTLGLIEADDGSMPPGLLRLDLFREIAAHFAEAVDSWGGTLTFVYLPSRNSFIAERVYPYDEIMSVVRELEIPTVDLLEVFRQHEDPLDLFPFRRFGHYNEEGHALVAETVMREAGLQGGGR